VKEARGEHPRPLLKELSHGQKDAGWTEKAEITIRSAVERSRTTGLWKQLNPTLHGATGKDLRELARAGTMQETVRRKGSRSSGGCTEKEKKEKAQQGLIREGRNGWRRTRGAALRLSRKKAQREGGSGLVEGQ